MMTTTTTMRATTSTALLLSIIFLFCSYRTISSTLTKDGVSLLSFKYSILSDPLRVLDSWSSYNHTPCSWQGVSCSAPKNKSHPPRVIGLSLPGSQLLGSIPANLTLLDQLQRLNLSSNSINGSIPDALFTLPNLRLLDLSENFISGDLPEFIGNLRSLEVLDISENALEGNIPRNLSKFQNLTTVSLRGNYFSGNLPSGFHRVKYLDLSSNLINGSLPVDFGGSGVEYLNISFNRITGEIPAEFGADIPANATLDFSSNYLTGEIPDSRVFLNQESDAFAGNSDLCGPPSGNPCPIPSSSVPLPYAVDQPIPPPAIAVIPKGQEVGSGSPSRAAPTGKNNTLRPQIILAIIVGDLIGIIIFAVVFIYVCRRKKKGRTTSTSSAIDRISKTGSKGGTTPMMARPSLSCSSSSSESKGIAKWSCLKRKNDSEDNDDEEEDSEESQELEKHPQQGQLVTVDGERELELETLLKASAYILGASGSSIMYKAVLENGTVLAVRRVGECTSAERFKDFESQVRAIAKMVHRNLVRVRGFYWGSDEKLVIYEYVPNGSLANACHRKIGSSPSHISWDIRMQIVKGLARGLSYIHDKKHVHGNLKPSNVLLDSDMEPKIADFGLERLSMGKSGYIPSGSTRHFGSKRSTASRESFQDYSIGATPSPSASSIGCISPYHSPETLRSIKPNSKWDVYSFGVILLELLTGKVIVSDELGPPVLAGLAVGLDDKTRVLRMADPAIRGELESKEEDLLTCLKLGYNCIAHVPQKRPTMKEALHVLEKIPTSSSTPP